MQKTTDFAPCLRELDPQDTRLHAQTWIHDQLDKVDRQRDAQRDHDADPKVRSIRAQDYLDRKEMDELIVAEGLEYRAMQRVLVAVLVMAGLALAWSVAA